MGGLIDLICGLCNARSCTQRYRGTIFRKIEVPQTLPQAQLPVVAAPGWLEVSSADAHHACLGTSIGGGAAAGGGGDRIRESDFENFV